MSKAFTPMPSHRDELAGSARELLSVARDAFPRFELKQAETVANAARVCARAATDTGSEHEARKLLAAIAYEQGDLVAAERHYRQLADAQLECGHVLDAARTRTSIAFLRYDAGDALEATKELDAVELVAQASESHALIAKIADYRGNIARQAGAFEFSHRLYSRAIESASLVDELTAAVPRMDLAATMLLERRAEIARSLLAHARDAIVLAEDRVRAAMLSRIVDHYTTFAAMLTGRPATDREIEEGQSGLRAARVWLADATGRGRRSLKIDRNLLERLTEIEQSAETEHARISVRILRNHLGPSRDDGLMVIVSADGCVIERGTFRVDLSKRAALRAVLARLVWARMHAPATPVSLEALVAAGWPDERMQPRSARNRVHVALSTLRQQGLEGALIHRAGGYHLDPRRAVVHQLQD